MRKKRPAVIVSNDAANKHLNRVQVVIVSATAAQVALHCRVDFGVGNLERDLGQLGGGERRALQRLHQLSQRLCPQADERGEGKLATDRSEHFAG